MSSEARRKFYCDDDADCEPLQRSTISLVKPSGTRDLVLLGGDLVVERDFGSPSNLTSTVSPVGLLQTCGSTLLCCRG